MKKCPYCAEEVKSEAIKCKHCGSMLNAAHQQQAATIQDVIPNKKSAFNYKFVWVGLIAAIIVCVGVIFIMKDSSSPLKVSQNFVINIKKGDYASAKKHLSSDAKNTYSDTYLKRVHNKYKTGVTFTSAERLTMTGDKAIQIVEYIGEDSNKSTATIYLEKSFWGWRITNVSNL